MCFEWALELDGRCGIFSPQLRVDNYWKPLGHHFYNAFPRFLLLKGADLNSARGYDGGRHEALAGVSPGASCHAPPQTRSGE